MREDVAVSGLGEGDHRRRGVELAAEFLGFLHEAMPPFREGGVSFRLVLDGLDIDLLSHAFLFLRVSTILGVA